MREVLLKSKISPVLLLDNNIWRYISDSNAVSRLKRGCVRNKVALAIAPAAINEAFRTNDLSLRRRLVNTMIDKHWKRLMPDAYEEAMEILREIERVYPKWLRNPPDQATYRKLKLDWKRSKGGYWDRARYDCDNEAARNRMLEGNTLTIARAEAKANRELCLNSKITFHNVELNRSEDVEFRFMGQWVKATVEPWRIASLGYYSDVLINRGVHFEWLLPHVNLNMAIRDPDWMRFWLFDVEANRVPRSWVRWACEELHATRKVNDGTPVDTQMATYLFSCTHFITADGRFVDVIKHCKKDAGLEMADAILINAGERGVTDLVNIIDRINGNISRQTNGVPSRSPKVSSLNNLLL